MPKEPERILLAHGSGGSLSRRLVEDIFLSAFDNAFLAPLNDQAVFDVSSRSLAFTTDSYVIRPIFFPGGDIGKLSVCGTINDLAVGGAVPLYLSASFIIEEGMFFDELQRVVASMAQTAKKADVQIITGDTKVVERGKGDKLFINTAGIGAINGTARLSPDKIRTGDVIIVSGSMGDHGIAILAERDGIDMDTPVLSDCAPLHGLVRAMLLAVPDGIRAMRDPTRGGLATVLNEFAARANLAMTIKEATIPVKTEVKGACEILGFDPLYLANEGKLIAVVSPENASACLSAMKKDPLGRDSAIIGTVEEKPKGRVILETQVGSRRILEMLSGEQLPRIC